MAASTFARKAYEGKDKLFLAKKKEKEKLSRKLKPYLDRKSFKLSRSNSSPFNFWLTLMD